jgi:hypothetical protein
MPLHSPFPTPVIRVGLAPRPRTPIGASGQDFTPSPLTSSLALPVRRRRLAPMETAMCVPDPWRSSHALDALDALGFEAPTLGPHRFVALRVGGLLSTSRSPVPRKVPHILAAGCLALRGSQVREIKPSEARQ